MRVLVCGGRDFTDAVGLEAALDAFHQYQGTVTLLIHGGAPGADSLAGAWAKKNKIPTHVFRADWERFGRAAGPIRNDRMLLDGKPDIVIAFQGGRGTADMVQKAEAAHIDIIKV